VLPPWELQRDTNHRNVWGLAQAYRASLFTTIQRSKGEEGGNEVIITVADAAPPTSSADTPAPPTGTVDATATTAVAAPAPTVGRATAPIPATGTIAGRENQPMPVSVAPMQKKKYAKTSVRPVRDDNEPGPSQKQKKEAEPDYHLVPVPERAARHAERPQPPPRQTHCHLAAAVLG